MPTVVQSAISEREVKEAVASVPKPLGVKLRQVFFDVDHSGDEAVYALFSVSKSAGLGPARIRLLMDFQFKVKDVIDSLRLDRLPYVRFIDVK